MADRAFHNGHKALELEIVHLYGRFTVGAAGAPTLVTASSKGITSVARNSAGEYKIVLADRYIALLWGNVQLLTTTGSDPATIGIHARLEDDQTASANKYIQVQFYALDDGAAADPANGATVLLKFELKNTTV